MKYWIVWNAEKTEGFVTCDKADANYTSTGVSTTFGVTTVGDHFRECYAENDEILKKQEIEI